MKNNTNIKSLFKPTLVTVFLAAPALYLGYEGFVGMMESKGTDGYLLAGLELVGSSVLGAVSSSVFSKAIERFKDNMAESIEDNPEPMRNIRSGPI